MVVSFIAFHGYIGKEDPWRDVKENFLFSEKTEILINSY